MAISKLLSAAVRALSYPDLNIKKNYKLERKLMKLTNFPIQMPYYKIWDHAVPCGDHEVPVRLFPPYTEGEEEVLRELEIGPPDSLLLFFHGGGWVSGDIDSYTNVCASMARQTNRTVVSVDYRLAPEHRFPAGLEDCYQVAREIFLDTGLLGISAENIILIGDSAGGNLAAAVSLLARDRGEFLPRRQILIYPATYNDHGPGSPFPSIQENGTDRLLTSKRVCDYMELYQSGPEDRRNPYFAPLLAEDLSRQPDTLVLTAEFDPLRDEGEAYARRLEEAGCRVAAHRVKGALHGYFSLPPAVSQVRESYACINRFLNEVTQP